MSLRMKLVRLALYAAPRPFRTEEAVRRTAGRRRSPNVPLALRRRCRVAVTSVEGFPVITLTPRRPSRTDLPSGAELMYLHGGAYVFGLRRPHWWIISAIIRRTGVTVTVPLYGLAPQHSVAEALPFVNAVRDGIRRRSPGAPFFLAGDSAGGGLALAHLIDRRNRGEALPRAVFLIAPWVDCSMTNPAIEQLQRHDPLLDLPGLRYAARLWADGLPLDSWRVSPVNDTLEGLPPLLLFQGGSDLLLPDSERFAAKASAAGTPVELHVAPDGFHVYVAAAFTPEAAGALDRIADVVKGAAKR